MRLSTFPLGLPFARRGLLAFVGLVLALALLNSLAALQDYLRDGGQRPWEPFLWEFSSALVMAPLALAVMAGAGRLRGLAWPRQLAAHALALPLFSGLHVAGMFGLRLGVYGLLDLPYAVVPLAELLAYEGAKDAVSYGLLTVIARGLWAARAAALQAQELERTRRELAEARLARLADQVQPHFLFNSLNLIAAEMHEDVEKADRLLCDLAALLRQSLAAQECGEHSLAQELALVQPFLRLMQARFGADRLQIRVEASAAAQACRLPALLLLAPVENAIKHDVARHRGAVTVSLQAECREGYLDIVLRNDGVDRAAPPDGGLGLRNLRERLAARYGSLARVQFGPEGGGMTLRLSLPLEEGA